MALAETAELAVKLSLGGNFQRQMAGVNRSLKDFDKSASRAYRAGQQIGTGIRRGLAIAAGAAGLLATQVALGLDSLVKLEKATAQTEAVIKSTGSAAGVTAEQVRLLSEKYEALNATIGDETIQEGQNLLLTYTAITKEGFEPALQAALDLSVAMGTDLNSAVKTVGKALSEPEKAMARLRRQGIILTEAEEKQIKAHVKNNDTLAAQGVILGALEKRYGGSFLAGGSTTAGKVAKFTDSIEDLQRALATALLPAVGNIADALTELLQDPEVIKGAEDLGREIGNLFSKQNIKEGARIIGDVFNTLRSAAPVIKTALGTIGTVLKTAFDAFNSLPGPIQQLLIGGAVANKLTGGLVTNIAGGIFGALKAMTVQAGVVNVTGGVVNGGAAGAAGAAAGKGGGIIGAASKAISIAAIVASVAAVVATQQDESGKNTAFAAEIKAGLDQSIAGKTLPQLRTALSGVNDGINSLQSNPLLTLVQGDALNTLKTMQGDIAAQIARIDALKDQSNRTKDDTVAATNKVKTAQTETKRETGRGLSIVNQSTRSGASMVASAVRQSRPIITTNVKVSVTAASVSKEVTVQNRYGPGNGSAGGGSGHAPGTGPLP